jgi:hypothetical protein
MKSKIVWICLLFDLALLSGLFLYFTYESREDVIKAEIEKANYCETVTDCQQVAVSKCPFGCYVHVNKNEASRIEELLNGYQSTCEYGCIEMRGVDCVDNVCKVLH